MSIKTRFYSKDAISGGLFLIGGLVFLASSLQLPFGSIQRIGPGFFPICVAVALCCCGAALLLFGAADDTDDSGQRPGGFSARSMLLLLASVVAFGVLIVPFGFVPALAVTVLLSTAASAEYRIRAAVLTTVILVLLCWIVFIWALQLPIRSFIWPVSIL